MSLLKADYNLETRDHDRSVSRFKSAQTYPKKTVRHVAIIMDGNRRWAKLKGLPSVAGHMAGIRTVECVTQAALKAGVEVLTLYAFSTENWSRSPEEVNSLMKLMSEHLIEKTPKACDEGIRIRVIGDRGPLPESLKKAIEFAESKTLLGKRLSLCFAINYGGRDDLLRAVKGLAKKVQANDLDPDDIREWHLSEALDTFDVGDPDLFIRTSGEKRLSNFLLWQMAYTELYFSDHFWPDFNSECFFEALQDYEARARRYGV